MYRPKGWINLHNDIKSSRMLRIGTLRQETSDFEIFEAGADAMYEALWKMAEESPTKTFTLDANPINCPSVSIPEE